MGMDFRGFEQQGWERAARAYADSFTSVTGLVAEPLLDACLEGSGGILLDVATGPGTVARLAAAHGARAVGVDFSSGMLALASRHNKSPHEVLYVRGDADALPYRSGVFDAVTCNFGLLHFAHPDRAAREMARVVRNGGQVAVSVWSPPDRNVLFGAIYRALERHAPRRPEVPAGPAFFQLADPANMKALLEGAGLRTNALERVAFHVPFASPRAILDLFLEGSVRTAAILRAQDEVARARILEAVALELEPHRKDGTLRVPVEAVIGSGRKES